MDAVINDWSNGPCTKQVKLVFTQLGEGLNKNKRKIKLSIIYASVT